MPKSAEKEKKEETIAVDVEKKEKNATETDVNKKQKNNNTEDAEKKTKKTKKLDSETKTSEKKKKEPKKTSNETKKTEKQVKEENNTGNIEEKNVNKTKSKEKKEKTEKQKVNGKKVEQKENKTEEDKTEKKSKKDKQKDADVSESEVDNKEKSNIIELKDKAKEDKEHVKTIKFEDIKNIFKKKKKLPKEAVGTIIKPVFDNVLVAVVVMIYFIFLILGFYNIENSVYEIDLKVFSMCILFIAIMLLEKAYKKDSGKIAIFGIEAIVISIITLALIYINLMFSDKYIITVLMSSYILAIYYVIKSIVIYQKGKKKYFVDNMKEIINTDE